MKIASDTFTTSLEVCLESLGEIEQLDNYDSRVFRSIGSIAAVFDELRKSPRLTKTQRQLVKKLMDAWDQAIWHTQLGTSTSSEDCPTDQREEV